MSRRTVLKGAGITLALPLLDAMIPAATALAQTAAAPKPRFVGLFVPHGMAPGYWVPDKVGTDFEFPFNFKPLEPYRKHVTILSGLHSRSAEPPPGATGADHWVAAAFLCANKPRKTAGADVYVGTTIDQLIAKEIGGENLLPSLQLAVEDPGANSSNCGEGYSCTYTNTISWSAPSSPLPMELNPQVVFERMFGDGSTVEQRAARRKRDSSILDSLSGSVARLRGEVGAADKARLTTTRERARDRAPAADRDEGVHGRPVRHDRAVGVPQTFDEHIKLQFDLLALSFQADITRVGTLLFARDLTGRTYPESEAPTSGFHGVSHHGEDPRQIALLSKINQPRQDARAPDTEARDDAGRQRDAARPVAGALRQQHGQLQPARALRRSARAAVGGLNGKIQGNRHLAYPTKQVPTGNLLLSLLDKYDIHQDSIGDSTGRLVEL
jgi:hypothetical protein